MHATHLHPRRPLAVALVLLALGVTAVTLPPRLADGDFGLGGQHGTAAPASSVSGAPARDVKDPLASPLVELPAPVRWPPAR
jgi:hypothetical protein